MTLAYRYSGLVYTAQQITYVELSITIPCPIVSNVLANTIPAQFYQVSAEPLIFPLNTAPPKVTKCYLTYTVSSTAETDSTTLIQFDNTTPQFTFYESDLSLSSIVSPYYAEYSIMITATQKEAFTVRTSFTL